MLHSYSHGFPKQRFQLVNSDPFSFLDFSTAGILKNAKFKMQLKNSREMMTIKHINPEGSHAQVARKSKVRGKKRRALLFLRPTRLRLPLAPSLATRN